MEIYRKIYILKNNKKNLNLFIFNTLSIQDDLCKATFYDADRLVV